ncbi:MAG: hypothetical protein ACRDDZ_01435 [Marinifilaceae bacterium]
MNKLQELQSEIDALRHENEAYKKAQDLLKEDIEKANAQIKHLKDVIAGARACKDLLELDLVKKEGIIWRLRSENEQLKKDVEELS